MNILIYFGKPLNPRKGGTERVACTIVDYLSEKGHCVLYMAAYKNIGDFFYRRCVFLPDEVENATERNVAFIQEYIIRHKISVIINEGASNDSIYLFSHEHIPKNIRIISHLHFSVLDDINNFYSTLFYPLIRVSLKQCCINLLKWLKAPYNKNIAIRNKFLRYQYMHKNSDYVVVLSPNQKCIMEKFLHISFSEKIVACLNPCDTKTTLPSQKENTILYVGRLDYSSKRVDRVLKVWKQLQGKLSDWNLVIVGSGRDEKRLKRIAESLKLYHITFAGFTDPIPYYLKAKLLLLTSNYEGTPMVITEAMATGTIPVVMNSFIDANFIIKNNINGIITPAFDIDAMVDAISRLVSDEDKMQCMSLNAIKTVSGIDNDERLSQWLKIIE